MPHIRMCMKIACSGVIKAQLKKMNVEIKIVTLIIDLTTRCVRLCHSLFYHVVQKKHYNFQKPVIIAELLHNWFAAD